MMGKITLQGVKNARDLGGIRTADGRRIRNKRLLKCGQLYEATEQDLAALRDEYDVKLIVDLRTEGERQCFPDPEIRGVSNIWNPIFKEDIQGASVFTPGEKEILEKHLKSLFILSHRNDSMEDAAAEDVRQMITQEEFDPETYMARMYHKFINNQVIQKQIKQFFSLLVNRRGGAVLWHCGAGKDRSGICSALLLYALGVPKDKIIEDYALSAESSEDTVEYILEKLFPADVPGNDEYQALARRIFGAKTCYIEEFFKAIEKDFISVDNYLQKAVELHVDNLVRLKTLYLK
ncbi:MAG: tyrosine-protein phosphatase [Clostridiales bacterium]|nr:tyrosine-protein phosphatase [Clostridiales bacterium]